MRPPFIYEDSADWGWRGGREGPPEQRRHLRQTNASLGEDGATSPARRRTSGQGNPRILLRALAHVSHSPCLGCGNRIGVFCFVFFYSFDFDFHFPNRFGDTVRAVFPFRIREASPGRDSDGPRAWRPRRRGRRLRGRRAPRPGFQLPPPVPVRPPDEERVHMVKWLGGNCVSHQASDMNIL